MENSFDNFGILLHSFRSQLDAELEHCRLLDQGFPSNAQLCGEVVLSEVAEDGDSSKEDQPRT